MRAFFYYMLKILYENKLIRHLSNPVFKRLKKILFFLCLISDFKTVIYIEKDMKVIHVLYGDIVHKYKEVVE